MKNPITRTSRLLLNSRRAPPRAFGPRTLFQARTTVATSRSICTTQHLLKGLQPHSSDPKPPKPIPSPASAAPAQISDAEYHDIADQYLDALVLAAEEYAEANATEGLEVEYSAGVLTITTQQGTYVLNKQPPNKQIWLSSPTSGPKRYDWVVSGAGQHEKEGSTIDVGDDGSGGKWVYLRDHSDLSSLLKKELGIEVGEANNAQEGTE